MFTIYSSKETTSQPYNIPTQDIEDCRDRQFVINLVCWFLSEVSGPLALLVVIAIFWPVILY